MNIIKQYIVFIENEVYKAYGQSEQQAINKFKTACLKYRFTDNEHYQEYWDKLMDALDNKNYMTMENTNFEGVEKIT